MQITQNGVTLQMEDAEILDMALRRIAGDRDPRTSTAITMTAIGAAYNDGIFAGIGRRVEGNRDHRLIVLGEAPEKLNQADAIAWCESAGGILMSRWDSALCFANVPEIFRKDEWYWTSTQYAGDGDYAWFQHFGDGDQNDVHKVTRCRARAVRRELI